MAEQERKFGKGISVVSGFDLGAAAPVDSKYTVATKAEMEAHKTGNRVYEGMQVFCEEDKTLYIYKNGEFGKLDQSTAVETTVTVKGAVNDATFKVGSSATSEVTLALKKVVDAGKGCKVTFNEAGQVTAVEALAESDIPAIPHTKVTGLGDVATLNKGTANGNVVVVGENGKISEDVLPALALSEVSVVDSQEAMLQLQAQPGDVAVRSDIKKSFILKEKDATSIDSWVELKSPTDKVQSVNGKTGVVVLSTKDVAEDTNLYYTEERATANFTTNFTKANSTSLADSDTLFRKGEKLAATDVTEDKTHRFVTDTDKTNWADKYSKAEVDKKVTDLEGKVAAVPVVEKLTFDATNGWGELQDTTYTLTLEAQGKTPVSAVYRKNVETSNYEAIVADVVQEGNNIKIISMEKFEGYILVFGLPAKA